VDLEIASTCSTPLRTNSTYRFEVEIDNTGEQAGSPTGLFFNSTVGTGDIFGSIEAGDILNSGCSTNTDWIESIDGSTNASAVSGTTCSISASGSEEFWMIITLDPDADDDTALFSMTDGTVADVSTTTTFTVHHTVTYDINFNNGTNFGGGTLIQGNASSQNNSFSLNGTGHVEIGGLSGNQNVTVVDSNNIVVFKDYNFNVIGDVIRTLTTNIFTVDCASNGNGNDFGIKE